MNVITSGTYRHWTKITSFHFWLPGCFYVPVFPDMLMTTIEVIISKIKLVRHNKYNKSVMILLIVHKGHESV